WAALFYFLEKRRRLFQDRRTARIRRQRNSWYQRAESGLRGLRTFRSLGGERFLERRLADHFDRFLRGIRRVSLTESWGEHTLPSAMTIALCVLVALASKDPLHFSSGLFLALGVYVVVHRAARSFELSVPP